VVGLIESAVGIGWCDGVKLYSSLAYCGELGELLEAPPPIFRNGAALRWLPRRTLRAFQRVLNTGTRLADRVFGTDSRCMGGRCYFEDRGRRLWRSGVSECVPELRAGAEAAGLAAGFRGVCIRWDLRGGESVF